MERGSTSETVSNIRTVQRDAKVSLYETSVNQILSLTETRLLICMHWSHSNCLLVEQTHTFIMLLLSGTGAGQGVCSTLPAQNHQSAT